MYHESRVQTTEKEASSRRIVSRANSIHEINLQPERGQRLETMGILTMLINNSSSKQRFIKVENHRRKIKSTLVRGRTGERYEFLFLKYLYIL